MINPYRLLRIGASTRYFISSTNGYENTHCDFFLKSPEPGIPIAASYDDEYDTGYIPVIFSNEVIEKSSFSSAYNAIYAYYNGLTYKVKIGKSDKILYVNSRYAFEKNSVTKEYHLMYLMCNEANRAHANVAYLSPEFIYDTKTSWYTGFKTHVLGHLSRTRDLITVVNNNLDSCIVKEPAPKSIDYVDDIQKFLKSDAALEYAERFIR